MTSVSRRSRSGFADDELLAPAEATASLPSLEAACAGEFARLVIGVLANRELEPLGDAIVADGVRREPRDEAADVVENRHARLPPLRRLPERPDEPLPPLAPPAFRGPALRPRPSDLASARLCSE